MYDIYVYYCPLTGIGCGRGGGGSSNSSGGSSGGSCSSNHVSIRASGGAGAGHLVDSVGTASSSDCFRGSGVGGKTISDTDQICYHL